MMGGVHTPRGEGSAAAELKVPPSSPPLPVTVRPGFESREKQKFEFFVFFIFFLGKKIIFRRLIFFFGRQYFANLKRNATQLYYSSTAKGSRASYRRGADYDYFVYVL